VVGFKSVRDPKTERAQQQKKGLNFDNFSGTSGAIDILRPRAGTHSSDLLRAASAPS
jgi:hypothetical protein